MRPDRQHDRVEALFPQLANREIAAGGLVQSQRDVARFENFADLRLDHAPRQAVFRECQGCSIPPATGAASKMVTE